MALTQSQAFQITTRQQLSTRTPLLLLRLLTHFNILRILISKRLLEAKLFALRQRQPHAATTVRVCVCRCECVRMYECRCAGVLVCLCATTKVAPMAKHKLD